MSVIYGNMVGGSAGSSVTIDTSLSVSGQAADAKATGDAINLLSESITTSPTPFKVQEIGELYDQPLAYTAWCSGSLRFDKNLEKYVDLLYCAPKHENPDYTANYITYIDPKTYEATAPALCKYYDTDGSTELTITFAGRPAFVILQDGSYMMLQTISKVNYRFISNDHGLTWVKGETVSGFSGSTENYALVQLSNGRILANAISRVINYSDDGGITWTSVTPTTAGNSYEAEYFFLEVKPGVVLGICRMTVGGNGRTASGECEHAVITVSEDYGTTWADLKVSDTIDNMNASTCTGCVHDGIVEIFAASRWYHSGDYAVTDYTNTGKSGAITHYVATIENALNDNFTKLGVVVYAKTTSNASTLAAQDFHTPCMAVNGSDMLMVYFDRVAPYNVADQVNHYYIRGSLSGIDYGVRDDLESTIFPLSSAQIIKLLTKQKNELIVKFNEAILSGTPIPPGEGDDPGTFVFDGLVANFNFTDDSTIDKNAMTVTDTINGIAAVCTNDSFPEVRSNSVNNGTFKISGLPSFFEGQTEVNITVEIALYYYPDDTWSKFEFWLANAGGAPYPLIRSEYAKFIGIDAEGGTINYAMWATINPQGEGFKHVVAVYDSTNGIGSLYVNGEFINSYSHESFSSWSDVLFGKYYHQVSQSLKTYRVYNRALTADEVAINYNYEQSTIV